MTGETRTMGAVGQPGCPAALEFGFRLVVAM